MWEKSKVREERWGGGSRAEFPLEPMGKTMVRKLCPCSPWGSRGAEIHLQPTEGSHGGDGGSWRRLWPYGIWLLAGPVTSWREDPVLEQVCWQDLRPCGGCDWLWLCPWRAAPHGRDSGGAVNFRKVSPYRSSQRTLSVHWSREEWEEFSLWGGRNDSEFLWWIDCHPYSPFLCPAGEENVESSGSKWSLERREKWGEGVLKVSFYFSLYDYDWIGRKLN